MNKFIRSMVALLFLLTAACSLFPTPGGLPAATQTPPATASPPPATKTSQPVTETVDTTGPVTLQIWLPPQFDPASGTEAGQLLENHLNQFAERHPGVR
ncbi:MAG: hypothetical protein EHM70_11100, partial [Chloroflexota bacterium]